MAYNGFKKSERLNSAKVIDQLFQGNSGRESIGGSLAAFPLRCVWKAIEIRNSDLVPVSVLIVAPKKRLRHAVDRNRMKRQIREAYRRHKHILWNAIDKCTEVTGRRFTVALALLCISDTPVESIRVEKAVVKALIRISEALQKPDRLADQHASNDVHTASSRGTHTNHHD